MREEEGRRCAIVPRIERGALATAAKRVRVSP